MDQRSSIGWVLSLALACGACHEDTALETDLPVARRGTVENTPPVLREIRIEPDVPVSGQRIRAVVSALDAQGDRLELRHTWRIDGTMAGSGPEIELEEVRRGSIVELVVTASDGLSESTGRAEAVVADRRPILVGLSVAPPKLVSPGDVVSAAAQARDPDGDEVYFEYEWLVNGEPSGTGSTLATADLHLHDEIRVTVWAMDGVNRSDPLTSAVVRVGSAHPEIVSTPPSFREDGVFQYAVEAEDPDGDRLLRFRLREGPEGMRIDEISGKVTWRPTHQQTGLHPVAVVVRDSAGLETTQSFQVTVRGMSPAPPAAPAPSEE